MDHFSWSQKTFTEPLQPAGHSAHPPDQRQSTVLVQIPNHLRQEYFPNFMQFQSQTLYLWGWYEYDLNYCCLLKASCLLTNSVCRMLLWLCWHGHFHCVATGSWGKVGMLKLQASPLSISRVLPSFHAMWGASGGPRPQLSNIPLLFFPYSYTWNVANKYNGSSILVICWVPSSLHVLSI